MFDAGVDVDVDVDVPIGGYAIVGDAVSCEKIMLVFMVVLAVVLMLASARVYY